MTGVDGQRPSSAVDRHIGGRLAARRIQLELTPLALAQKVGVSLQQVQAWEEGRSRISARLLTQLAQNLHVAVTYFFDDVGAAQASTFGPPAIFSGIRGPTHGFTLNDNAAPSPHYADDLNRLVTAFSVLPSHDVRLRAITFVEFLAGV